jgi:hypothetical protein
MALLAWRLSLSRQAGLESRAVFSRSVASLVAPATSGLNANSRPASKHHWNGTPLALSLGVAAETASSVSRAGT